MNGFFVAAAACLFSASAPMLAAAPASPGDQPPVGVSIRVAPAPAAPGGEAAVTVVLEPKAGIKLNRYPKIKLAVGETPGVVAAAEGAIGSSGPPPADQLDANYYKGGVDPLVVPIKLDPAATPGQHDVHGKLTYYYCVAASGYCAPAKVDVSIPIIVR